MSNSVARKDNSKAIGLVDMDAMLLLALGAPSFNPGYTDENLVEIAPSIVGVIRIWVVTWCT